MGRTYITRRPILARGANQWMLNLDGSYYAEGGNVLNVGVNDMSLSAWVWVASTASRSMKILSKRDLGAPNEGWELRANFHQTGLLDSSIDAGATRQQCYSDTDLYQSRWVHVAVVFDRNSAANTKCYYDGVDTTDAAGTDTNDSTSAVNITLGSGIGGATSVWQGKIAEVRIWIGGIWTLAEIQYQYNNFRSTDASGGTYTERWPCNEGTGTTLNGDNGTDLTLTSASAWEWGNTPS